MEGEKWPAIGGDVREGGGGSKGQTIGGEGCEKERRRERGMKGRGEKEALRGRSMRCSPAVHLPNLKRRSANDFPGRLLRTDGAREERRRRESRKIRLQRTNAYRWERGGRKISL